MITTLSFTISGKPSAVKARAEEFMQCMATLIGKPVKGTTLVALQREDNLPDQRKALAQWLRSQRKQHFSSEQILQDACAMLEAAGFTRVPHAKNQHQS